MPVKRSSYFAVRSLVLIVTILACAVFAYTFAQAAFISPKDDQTVPSSAPISQVASTTPTIPDRLVIPSINVDANVQAVGIGKTGNMAVPTNYNDVGWYRSGTLPGAIGSAVMDGHMDNGFGLKAVLYDIKNLKIGDDIYVEAKDGSRVHFVVTDIETYMVDAVPLELIFNRNDAARLNIITCDGTWESDKKMYDKRTVVYAQMK